MPGYSPSESSPQDRDSSAMLDVPIYLAGKVSGIVCHEHVGAVRRWTERDREFAASVAEVIARLYQEAALAQAETTLGTIRSYISRLERLSA